MEQSQPGVLRAEAKLGLIRTNSGNHDYFGDELATPHAPAATTMSSAAPYSVLWDHRLSTITEETTVLNPETDNILTYKSSLEEKGRYFGGSSSDKKYGGTLV